MNQNQKRILIAVIAVFVAMFLYPPFQVVRKPGIVIGVGYDWIFNLVGRRFTTINVSMLLIQWFGVLVVGGIAFFLTKGAPLSPGTSPKKSTVAIPPIERGMMNRTDIKKIIAREGLTLIGIFLLFGAMFFLDYRESDKQHSFEQKARIAEIVEPAPTTLETAPYSRGSLVHPTGIHIMVQKPIDWIKMDEALKRDFPNLRNPSFVALDNVFFKGVIQDKSGPIYHYYSSNGSRITFTDYGTAIIMTALLYPSYWLVRFVFWSIRTLKRRKSWSGKTGQ